MKIIKRNNAFSPSSNLSFDNFFHDDFFNWPSSSNKSNWNSLPPVNISETDKDFNVELAAPGFSKDDFKVELNHDKLVVSAERKDTKEENDKNFSRKEFIQSSFSRTFHLPENKVAEDEIKAAYENGVLSFTLPKRKEAIKKASRKIEIF
jgi:HSP20 family protein